MVGHRAITLRDKLSVAFGNLFVEDAELRDTSLDLFLKKAATNLPKKLFQEAQSGSAELGCCDPGDGADGSVAAAACRPKPPAFVKRQTIVGLFGDNIDATGPLLEDTLFSNGNSVDLEHRVYSFIETPSDKKDSHKIFTGERYAPSDALIVASVNCFSRKKKRHFFRDGLYLCAVFAKELSMSLSIFLQVRGWLVVNKKGTISISYRRISDCLHSISDESAVNYCRVSAIFERLYRVISSREIWPQMPYEKRKLVLYGFIPNC